MKELLTIQENLVVGKDLYNKFGGYAFRSAETILSALKPLLSETRCTIKLSDELVQVGDRIYVKATATLKNSSGEVETADAYAREDDSLKGMASSQITGSTSSYARKYALNGLLAIDDTKDADATNDHGKSPATTETKAPAKTTAKTQSKPAKAEQPAAKAEQPAKTESVKKDAASTVIQKLKLTKTKPKTDTLTNQWIATVEKVKNGEATVDKVKKFFDLSPEDEEELRSFEPTPEA